MLRPLEPRSVFPDMICLLLVLVFSVLPAFSAPKPPNEEIVVTANAYPVPFENLSRTVTVLTQEDIANLPVHSIADVLAQAVSADPVGPLECKRI
jgi:outer membrane cobalamin receptor